MILEEEGWADLAAKGFDHPRQFAAFLHTLRWNCVTATDPNLFQAPFRAGIPLPPAEYQGSIYENQRASGRRYFATPDEAPRLAAE